MKFIKLTQGKTAIVDNEMFHILNAIKWHAHENRGLRACRSLRMESGKQKSDYLHWYVAGKPLGGFVTDHINGNSLDNRRSNLRIVSIRQNSQNNQFTRTGRLLGAFKKGYGKWQSSITINKKNIHLGTFATDKEAHSAYMKAYCALAKEKS